MSCKSLDIFVREFKPTLVSVYATIATKFCCQFLCVCVCACVRVCVCMRACVRACVRAWVRACMRVMYVTTTTHKYNSLRNVSHFFKFRQSNICVFVSLIVMRLQQGSSLCKYYYVTTRNESPVLISYRKS